eukprot:CAMPEP_0203909332 /NCGR_PEP_ID=MMETSP0359-20131031/50639_1 /ASSEMBLY_ACC=CAM_ASM_000338 /TAXON_ID=268821 /ORGANISM="Scrippsiella Hangoei, Strain SHTV-5" /LENGTH=712 /DNA_ID=CAMNT_0050834549 /DNA_START=78 /DNA_END=2216 /DNA_ORIENTATION=-
MPAAVAAADEGLQRFRALLASQVATLGNALAAGFERELREVRQAGQQAAEAERTSRLAAEVDVRQLELEFERLRSELGELRAENGELCRRVAAAARAAAAPTPKRAPSESAEGSDPEPFFSTRGEAGRDDEDDDASPGSAAGDAAGDAVAGVAEVSPGSTQDRCAAGLSPRTHGDHASGPLCGAGRPGPAADAVADTEAEGAASEGRRRRGRARGAADAQAQHDPLTAGVRQPAARPQRGGAERDALGAQGASEGARGGRPWPSRVPQSANGRHARQEDPPKNPQGCLPSSNPGLARKPPRAWRQGAEESGVPGLRPTEADVEKENQQGEFESVSTFQEWGEVIVHSCLFQADLVRMYVQHSGFCFPRTFGPEASNEDVYAECGSSLVAHALSGQLSTIFMFGQTGSGKTYTMNTIIDMAAAEIFGSEGVASAADPAEAGVRLRVFEIKGNKCVDLMSRARSELKLLESEDGRTNVVGAQETPVSSVEDLQRAVHEAFARRATASHGRNEESSRSHCICIVELPAVKGSLVLVDCAGTERRQDTDQHSAERTKESAEINSSLHALKECIRYRAKEQRQALQATKSGGDEERKQVHVPYRGSYLTRVLAESFTRAGSRLAAIGTVAPSATDVEHTLSTLRTLQLLMNETGSTDAPNFDQRVDLDPKLVQLWTARMKKGGTEGEASLRSANSTPCGSHRRIRSDTGRADADERT